MMPLSAPSVEDAAATWAAERCDRFDFLSDEYRDLFAKSGCGPFQHPIWLHHLYTQLAPAIGATPVVIVVREPATGRLVAVLPLSRRRIIGSLTLEFADFGVSDHAASVVDPVYYQRLAADAGLGGKIRTLAKPFDVLWLRKLTRPGDLMDAVFGKPAALMPTTTNAVALSAPFDAWRKANVKDEQGLPRKRRSLARVGRLELKQIVSADEIDRFYGVLREFRAYRLMTRKERDILLEKPYYDFYTAIAKAGAASGFAQTFALTLDDEPLGVAFGLAYARILHLILISFEGVKHTNKSTGLLMVEDIMRVCAERGDIKLDFLTGSQHYKKMFGAQSSSLWEMHQPRTPLGLFSSAVIANRWRVRGALEKVRGKRN